MMPRARPAAQRDRLISITGAAPELLLPLLDRQRLGPDHCGPLDRVLLAVHEHPEVLCERVECAELVVQLVVQLVDPPSLDSVSDTSATAGASTSRRRGPTS
jgi:hypothetical protein